MSDQITIIRANDIDFAKYEAETEPLAKVHSIDAWQNELVEYIGVGGVITGTKLP